MRKILSLLLLAILCTGARAEVPLDGTFLAQRNCPALQSINRQTNPGNVTVTPGSTYRVVAANKAEATHYWIVVPGAQPDRRWVAVDCGTIEGVEAGTPSAQTPTPSQSTGPEPQYILAVYPRRQLAAGILRGPFQQARMPRPDRGPFRR